MNAARSAQAPDALLPAAARLVLKLMIGLGALAAAVPLLLIVAFVLTAAASPF
jgi:hypothetical protein